MLNNTLLDMDERKMRRYSDFKTQNIEDGHFDLIFQFENRVSDKIWNTKIPFNQMTHFSATPCSFPCSVAKIRSFGSNDSWTLGLAQEWTDPH